MSLNEDETAYEFVIVVKKPQNSGLNCLIKA